MRVTPAELVPDFKPLKQDVRHEGFYYICLSCQITRTLRKDFAWHMCRERQIADAVCIAGYTTSVFTSYRLKRFARILDLAEVSWAFCPGRRRGVWAPRWTYTIASGDRLFRQRVRLLRQLKDDPFARQMIASHPDTLDKLLEGA